MSQVFLLVGFPGTGKYTIAKAMSDQLEAAGREGRVVDNHYVNNPIFGLIDLGGGREPFPASVWDRVAEVRWFIFTNFLVQGPGDEAWVARLAELGERRRATFVPVRLLCSLEEICRRHAQAERRLRLKPTETERLAEGYAREQLLDLRAPASLTLDVTSMSARRAAARILAHGASLD